MWVSVPSTRVRSALLRICGWWARGGAAAVSVLLVLGVLALGLVALRGSELRVTARHTAPTRAPVDVSLEVTVWAHGAAATPLPLANARVRVLLSDGANRYVELGARATDAQGRARFDATVGGVAWVLVDHEGHARASRRVSLFAEHRLRIDLGPAHALAVTVVDEEEKPIAGATVLVRDAGALPFGGLTEPNGERVFGRLGRAPWDVEVFARGYQSEQRLGVEGAQRFVLRRLGGLTVHVIDSEGGPAAGAEVFIVGATLWPARRARTNAAGDVELRELSPGVYNLKAQLGSKASPEHSGVVVERGEQRRIELRLNTGRAVQVLVVDPSPGYDEPIAGASVVLAEYGVCSFPVSARSGKDGTAFLSPVPLGGSFISVVADGFVARSAVPVPSETDGPLRVALLKGATLLGKVTDPEGRPIDGARVEVIGTDVDGLPIDATPLLSATREAHFESSLSPLSLVPSGELGITLGAVPYVAEALSGQAFFAVESQPYEPWLSDFAGEFKAFPVPPGKVRALVRHPSYVEGSSEQVVLGPGGEARVTVVLSPGGELIGRVVDDDDRPVPLARIQVTATRGSFQRTAYALEDGTFGFSAVPSSIVLLLARPDEPTRFVVRKTLRVPSGASTEIELVLPEEREPVSVSVLGADAGPIELAEVQFTSVDPDVPLRATRFTDASGKLALPDASALAVRVQVSAPGFLPWSKEYRAIPEELEVTLQRGVLVEGRVTGVRGRQELAGARVTLSVGTRRDTTFTDALGRYTFHNVPVGLVRLSLRHDDFAHTEREFTVSDPGREGRAFEVETIDLLEASTLSGVVTNPAGEPVVGARVGVGFAPAFVVAGQLPEGFVLSDARGRFVLDAIEPGRLSVSGYADAVGRGSVELDVEEGRDVDDLVLVLDEPVGEADANLAGGTVAVTLGERDTDLGADVVVIDVAQGSEAERAGLLPGDVLERIDGERVSTMGDARLRLDGAAGTDVVLVVLRAGQSASYRVRREAATR